MRGLRGRVTLLCLVVVCPLLVMLASVAIIGHATSLGEAAVQAEGFARSGAELQTDIVGQAASTLRILAQGIRDMHSPSCLEITRRTADADPRIDAIVLADATGQVTCSSAPLRDPLSIASRDYFQRASVASPDGPPIVDIVLARVTGRPVVVTALPLPPAGPGQKAGVIVAVLSSDWLAKLAARIPASARHEVLVIDPALDAVLGRNSTVVENASVSTIPAGLPQAFLAQPAGGNASAVTAGGTELICGFAPIHIGGQRLMLVVGLDRVDVLAEIRHRIAFGAALSMVALISALALASWAANVFLLKPIGLLSGAAIRLGAGELVARAPTNIGVTELCALAIAFNRMATRLQARNRQLTEVQRDLRASERHHRLLADNSTDMITLFGPDFRRTYVSPACHDLLGYRPEELVGTLPGGIVHPDDWLMLDATLNAPLKAGQTTARATYRGLCKDGSAVWLESAGRRLESGEGFVVVTRDVSDRKAFELGMEAANRQLEELARHDSLTGLANRRRFEEVLAVEHRRAVRASGSLGVVIIDIDWFKSYNDTYGHPAGDMCLRAVGQTIGGVVRRPGDIAARLGGEEFAILLAQTDEAGAAELGHLIRDTIRERQLEHSGSSSGIVTVSVGVAVLYPEHGAPPERILQLADQALYLAKREGRDTVRVAELQTPR